TLLFVLLTWRREGTIRMFRTDWKLIGGAVTLLLLNQLAFVYALKLGHATTTGLILGATPVFVLLIAAALGVEHVTARTILATAVSFGGVGLIAGGSSGSFSGDIGADLLAVSMAVTWAGYSVLMMPLMRRYSPYRISAVVLLAMWVVLMPIGAKETIDQTYSVS